MTEEKNPIDEKMKNLQLNMLERIGNGGLNNNDLMAFMQMLQKGDRDSSGINDIMPMIVMSKMMNPSPKADPMMMQMMMEMMKNNGNSELKKEIEFLKAQIQKQEEDKKYNLIMERINELSRNKDTIGTKELLQIMASKDAAINQKDKELLQTQMNNNISLLQAEIRNKSSESDIGKVSETIKAIKNISSELGIGTPVEKSKEDILSGLVGTIADKFAPAINTYMQSQVQNTNSYEMPNQMPSQLTPEQESRIQEIHNKRNTRVEGEPEYIDTSGGEVVYDDLVNISDGKKKTTEVV